MKNNELSITCPTCGKLNVIGSVTAGGLYLLRSNGKDSNTGRYLNGWSG